MPGLEELFAFGTLSKEFDLKGIKVRLNVLDARQVQSALNSSYGEDEVARLVEYKKQILARSISMVNGVEYIVNPDSPTATEIKAILDQLGRFHVHVVNALYDFYDEMDEEVKDKLEADVKK